MPYNLKDLSRAVLEKRADLGIAFDADGDRVGFLDEKGRFIFADEILLLLARDILAEDRGKKILFDVKCSQLLFEFLPQWGGIPLMHKTGHGSIKDTLRQDPKVVFGGEVSGHFYFIKDYFKIDDGFYAAAYVLRLLSEFDGPLSKMFSFVPPRIRTPEIKLPCPDEVKFQVVDKITQEFSPKYEVVTTDGVRVLFDDQSWGLIRASDTAPYLTVRVEGLTKRRVLEIKNIFADALEKCPEVADKLNRNQVYSLTGKLGYL
jgi:phosphomannomutase/phosphoglucomutase